MTDISKIDMNRVDGLISLLESIDYVVEYKLPTEEDPSWYRVYKSGWLEQGGIYKDTEDKTVTINLLKPFKTHEYTVHRTNITENSGTGSSRADGVSNRTTTSFKGYYLSSMYALLWTACGQGATQTDA